MEFCPTCGNMLLYELPHMERPARFYCPTCPYVCQIENKVKIKRHMRLVKKPIDPIFSDNDFSGAQKTTDEACNNCGHKELAFFEMQMRSADEPATIIFRCMKCKHTWQQ